MTGSRAVAACMMFGGGLFVMALLAAPALAAGKSVAVTYDLFSPKTITIHVGDTITWTNRDTTFDHDVTFASFGSGTLKPTKSYTHKFATAGTFAYRCTIHLNTAKVVVTSPPTPQPTKRPTPTPPHAPPRPTPSPSASRSPAASASSTASASPTASPTASATETSTATASNAIAFSSTSPASSPASPATPVADAKPPTTVVLVLVLVLIVAGGVGLRALARRRR